MFQQNLTTIVSKHADFIKGPFGFSRVQKWASVENAIHPNTFVHDCKQIDEQRQT